MGSLKVRRGQGGPGVGRRNPGRVPGDPLGSGGVREVLGGIIGVLEGSRGSQGGF